MVEHAHRTAFTDRGLLLPVHQYLMILLHFFGPLFGFAFGMVQAMDEVKYFIYSHRVDENDGSHKGICKVHSLEMTEVLGK